MAFKKVLSQIKKALHLIEKEHWIPDAAIEAAFTSVQNEISLEEFEELIEREIKEK